MIFYRLRDGRQRPSFLPGQLYRLLQEDRTPGYVFLEVDGMPQCVWVGDFEPVESGMETPPGARMFVWRNEPLVTLPGSQSWVIYRQSVALQGPIVMPGQTWEQSLPRLIAWMDEHAEGP